MTNKKGFTLIELLAVIVILAIIALITAPLVVGIITNSRESSNKVSATNYISAVNHAITKAAIDNISVQNGYYEITKDGNICLGEFKNDKCTGEELKISANGGRPVNGNVTIEDEVVTSAIISYKDFSVELIDDGQIEYSPFALKYGIGKELTLNFGNNMNYNFYVIKEDADTITLLSSEALGESSWTTTAEHNSLIKSSETCGDYRCNFIGPITPMKALNQGFSGLDDLIIKDYEYINNNSEENIREYQKITIKNGVTTLTDYQGNQNIVPGNTVGRLITAEEYLELASRYNKNFTQENLKAILNENLELLKNSLNAECETIEEFFEFIGMEDDWLTAYFLVLAIYSEDLDQLSNFQVPEWLGLEGGTYWTSSNITLSEVSSQIFIIATETLPNGLYATVMISEFDATSTHSIRPVITIDKNSRRIQ